MTLASHDRLIAEGKLKDDPSQHAVSTALDERLEALDGAGATANGFLDRFLGRGSVEPPKGLYIWGPVGTGKTMLMDLFFADASLAAKRRSHFHAFMADVHGRIHALRKTRGANDAIAVTAQAIAGEARLLCLDEMQVGDIADAMIIGRLFEALLAHDVVIVTTSNLPPDRLYEHGLNRQLFLPFIRLISDRLDVIALDGATDYRLRRVKGFESFVMPLGPEADARVQSIWERLTDTRKGEPKAITVLGRTLKVPETARRCARFDFADLCGAPLGPPDALALAENFDVVFCERIPALDKARRNEAKRFVILIDALYDRHKRFVASSAAAPRDIYPAGDHSLEFARTASRLEEMQSAVWWGATIADT